MSMDELISDMDDTIFQTICDQATYTPKSSGVPRQVRVLVDRNVSAFPGGFDSSLSQTRHEASLRNSEVGIPKKGDRLRLKGENYLVDELIDNDGSVVRVVINDA